MSTLILGLLTAMPLLLMFRLKSWVISAVVLMLCASVVLSVTTEFHTINHAISMVVLITSVVLLHQHQLRFGDLVAFNFLLFIHVLSAYVSDTVAFVLVTLFVVLYFVSALVKNKPWLDWLLSLGLSVMWFIFGMNQIWISAVLIYSIYLLKLETSVTQSKGVSK